MEFCPYRSQEARLVLVLHPQVLDPYKTRSDKREEMRDFFSFLVWTMSASVRGVWTLGYLTSQFVSHTQNLTTNYEKLILSFVSTSS